MYPVPVALARADARQVPVPDEPVHLVQADPGFLAVVAEQAQLDPLAHLGEQPEVGPGSVVRRSQRIALARPHGNSGQMLPIPPAEDALRPSHLPIPVMITQNRSHLGRMIPDPGRCDVPR
jgi:hypothetical protein